MNRPQRTALQLAQIAYRRALTIHLREQHKGVTDGSVAQSRRMHFAAMALMRASGRLERANRDAQRGAK